MSQGDLMFRYLHGIALFAAAISLNYSFAFAQDSNSANYIMDACRDNLLRQMPNDKMVWYLAGTCIGEITGIGYAAKDLCIPANVTLEQMNRVVVKYIDDRPARLNENFVKLAHEALKEAFPCKN
jgi:hypothetical protein